MGYKVAVIGATGNVGREVLKIMAERDSTRATCRCHGLQRRFLCVARHTLSELDHVLRAACARFRVKTCGNLPPVSEAKTRDEVGEAEGKRVRKFRNLYG